MEKGYRYFGTDLTMLDTPFEAGLGRVRPARQGSRSSGATRCVARATPTGSDRRLRTLLIGGPDYVPVYGGEAVRLDGEVVGRLRSVAYGPTVDRTIGYAYLPAALAEGTALEVDVFDGASPPSIAPDVARRSARGPDARLELHDRAGCRHRDPIVEGAARGGAGGSCRIGPGQRDGVSIRRAVLARERPVGRLPGRNSARRHSPIGTDST